VDDTYTKLKHRAIDLLSRREHGESELFDKLLKKAPKEDGVSEVVQRVVSEMVALEYVSDFRFARSSIRSKALQGNGPLKIRQALKLKRVPEEVISSAFDELEIDWFENVVALRERKFGLEAVQDIKLKAKQQRFLQYRGYSFDHIQFAMDARDEFLEE